MVIQLHISRSFISTWSCCPALRRGRQTSFRKQGTETPLSWENLHFVTMILCSSIVKVIFRRHSYLRCYRCALKCAQTETILKNLAEWNLSILIMHLRFEEAKKPFWEVYYLCLVYPKLLLAHQFNFRFIHHSKCIEWRTIHSKKAFKLIVISNIPKTLNNGVTLIDAKDNPLV